MPTDNADSFGGLPPNATPTGWLDKGPTQGPYTLGGSAAPAASPDMLVALDELNRLSERERERKAAAAVQQKARAAQSAEAQRAPRADYIVGRDTLRGPAGCDARIVYAFGDGSGSRNYRLLFERVPSGEFIILRARGISGEELSIPIDDEGWEALGELFRTYGSKIEGPKKRGRSDQEVIGQALALLDELDDEALVERARAAILARPAPEPTPGERARRRLNVDPSPLADESAL